MKLRACCLTLIVCGAYANSLHAFHWRDLWMSADRQAQRLMVLGDFERAKNQFKRQDWKAAAAYRQGDFKTAAQGFSSMNNDEGYYNQGNAFAHLHQYEQAIKAFDRALADNPKHEDARYNRRIVEELLKNKSKQSSSSSSKDKQSSTPQQAEKNTSSTPKSQATDGGKSSADSQQSSPESKQPPRPNQQNQPRSKEHSLMNEKKDEQAKKQAPSSRAKEALSKQASQQNQEKQLENDRWLRLLQDNDFSYFLREKFRRDYEREAM